jgi:pimeloyl-ACP methyl ester carboxylesterase
MRFGPPVSYTHNQGGSRLAYQVLGDGDLDVVFLFGWPTHLALMWENPAFADFLHGLAAFSRLILFDRLGEGMSDRGPTGRAFEDGMDDIRTVLRAVDSERTSFFGCHLGGRLALLFAAAHPRQTTAVVTFGSHPTTLSDPDYPWGTTPEERERLLATFRAGTLDPAGLLAGIAPSESTDASRRWWSTFFSSAATPPESIDEITSFGPVDIRGLLGAVHTPTLVLHRTGDRIANVAASRYMAARLPQARLVELPGDDHLPFAGDQESVLAVTREFLTGTTGTLAPDRALLTVLFTDMVGSTRTASRLGDRRWRLLLERHDEVVREALGRFGGREIDTAGDGFLIGFDGPARAIAPRPRSEPASPSTGLRSAPACTPARSNSPATRSGASRSTSERGWRRPRRRTRSCAPAPSRTSWRAPASTSATGERIGSRASRTSGSSTRSSRPRRTDGPKAGVSSAAPSTAHWGAAPVTSW